MWSRAPRWVQVSIGLISGLFATFFGLALAVVLLGAFAFQGCDIDLDFTQPDPNPALTEAIRRCDVDAVEAEILKGGRPFIDGRFNFYEDGPGLTEALSCGPKMADLLLAYAVENGGGDSILHAAVEVGDPELVTRVLDAGIDIDSRDDAGDTALLDATTGGDGAMVDLLLTRGADDDVANDAGHTPLFRAVGLDQPLIVARLLGGGADPNLTARVTVLDIIAAQSLRPDGQAGAPGTSPVQGVIDVLRPALGFPPAEPMATIEPVTPLYLAVALGSDEVVVALLDAGADPTVGNGPSGHLPADAADLLGRTELAERIRATGG